MYLIMIMNYEHFPHPLPSTPPLILSFPASSFSSYCSALNFYLNFVRLQDIDIKSMQDTLSFYIVYMSHHIEPRLVCMYLAGICNQLEVYYSQIHEICNLSLVRNMLTGCLHMKSNPIKKKLPLSHHHLLFAIQSMAGIEDHDNLFFCHTYAYWILQPPSLWQAVPTR